MAGLKQWFTGGGFWAVLVLLGSLGANYLTTTTTLKNNDSNTIERLDGLSEQLTDLKGQIQGVRSAQDGVLQLRGEVAALDRRLANLEIDYKTQIQINSRVMADIARLESRDR